jgi:hypothetical protein
MGNTTQMSCMCANVSNLGYVVHSCQPSRFARDLPVFSCYPAPAHGALQLTYCSSRLKAGHCINYAVSMLQLDSQVSLTPVMVRTSYQS